jgi:hypothetical protein
MVCSDGEEDLPRAIQALKTATPPDASGRKTKHNDDARAASASDDEGSLTVPGEDACVELFKRFGKNSTGVLTLAEIDTVFEPFSEYILLDYQCCVPVGCCWAVPTLQPETCVDASISNCRHEEGRAHWAP